MAENDSLLLGTRLKTALAPSRSTGYVKRESVACAAPPLANDPLNHVSRACLNRFLPRRTAYGVEL